MQSEPLESNVSEYDQVFISLLLLLMILFSDALIHSNCELDFLTFYFTWERRRRKRNE